MKRTSFVVAVVVTVAIVLFAIGALILSTWVDTGEKKETPSGTETGQATEKETIPGSEKEGKTKLLEAGAEVMQAKKPLDAIHQHVCGFHFYADDIKRQVRAHHFCAHPNEEFLQCVIYDSDKPDARLIGIEYIISEKLFNSLPEEEKKLWHSHRYEVESGQLIAPGIPDVAEKEVMKKLISTYGKTWHTWQVDRGDKLPLGLPKLMMGFTADGQINPELLKQRDQDLGTNTEEKKRQRADIPRPEIAPGADAWEKGDVFQLDDSLLDEFFEDDSGSTIRAQASQ